MICLPSAFLDVVVVIVLLVCAPPVILFISPPVTNEAAVFSPAIPEFRTGFASPVLPRGIVYQR